MSKEPFTSDQIQRVLDTFSVGKIEQVNFDKIVAVQLLENENVTDPITGNNLTIPTALSTMIHEVKTNKGLFCLLSYDVATEKRMLFHVTRFFDKWLENLGVNRNLLIKTGNNTLITHKYDNYWYLYKL